MQFEGWIPLWSCVPGQISTTRIPKNGAHRIEATEIKWGVYPPTRVCLFSVYLMPKSKFLPRNKSRSQNPKSEIQNPKFKITNPKFKILNPDSKIQNPKSKIQNPKSKIPNLKFKDIETQFHSLRMPEFFTYQTTIPGQRLTGDSLFKHRVYIFCVIILGVTRLWRCFFAPKLKEILPAAHWKAQNIFFVTPQLFLLFVLLFFLCLRMLKIQRFSLLFFLTWLVYVNWYATMYEYITIIRNLTAGSTALAEIECGTRSPIVKINAAQRLQTPTSSKPASQPTKVMTIQSLRRLGALRYLCLKCRCAA